MTTKHADWQNIQERLEHLEQENRRLKRIGILSVFILCSVLIMGQVSTQNRILEAEGLSIRDASGKRRVWIGSTNNGSMGIDLFNSYGKALVSMGTNKREVYGSNEINSDAYFTFFDEQGQQPFGVYNRNKQVNLAMKSPNGTILLGELNDGTIRNSGVWLYDSNFHLRASYGLKNDGSPILSLGDKNSKYRLQLAVVDNGDPAIILSDPNGKNRVILAVRGYYGEPVLGLLDSNGKPLFIKP